jgi:murein DD-endopeptidase MepM/ murein hydrolase activator NlpD
MARQRSRWNLFFWGYGLGLVMTVLALWAAGVLHPASVSAGREVSTPPQKAGSTAPAPVEPQRAAIESLPEMRASSDEDQLIRRHLGLPIDGLQLESIEDTFNDTRGGTRRHEAADILAPRGTPVLAIDGGVIQKLFTSQAGGITIYQFDHEQTYCYYYAHLDRYADGIHEGLAVHRGHLIGYVGTTGNAPPNTPHLHLAIFRLGPEKRWWQGKPVNPFPILMGHFKVTE